MSEKKVTERMLLKDLRVLAVDAGREDLVAYCDKREKALDKRAANKSLTKVQKENLELVEVVFEVLSQCEKAVTVTELMAKDEKFENFSNQKMSALLKKLKDAGRVVKVTEKGKSYFSVKED